MTLALPGEVTEVSKVARTGTPIKSVPAVEKGGCECPLHCMMHMCKCDRTSCCPTAGVHHDVKLEHVWNVGHKHHCDTVTL